MFCGVGEFGRFGVCMRFFWGSFFSLAGFGSVTLDCGGSSDIII